MAYTLKATPIKVNTVNAIMDLMHTKKARKQAKGLAMIDRRTVIE